MSIHDAGGNLSRAVRVPADQRSREAAIRAKFEAELDAARAEAHHADGRATAYYQQYRAALAQVDRLVTERREQMKVLRVIRAGMERSRQDHTASRAAYEAEIAALKARCERLEKGT